MHYLDTEHSRSQKRDPEVRGLTLKMIRCSEMSIVGGDELDFTDSGEVLRKGTEKFRSLGLPFFDSSHPDDYLGHALLLD
jgi:hypothetical protein